MIRRGVSIRYGDVAVEAKENFHPKASESEFDTVSQLQQYNLDFANYSNPCELYQTVLDGSGTPFPPNPDDLNMGLWSEQLSGFDGVFENQIVLTLSANAQYSSQGFTLTFDNYNNIYANHLKIRWFRQDDLISEKDFYPDSAFYFCHNKVNLYDKIEITFYSMNMPKNRLKFRSIDYGYGTVFYGDELRNVKSIQEIDPISSEISINTVDFTLNSKSDIEYSFQAKQPLSVYFNGELKTTAFVKKSTRKAKRLWSIQSEDYIGLLDSIPYYGGIYTDKNAVELLTDIFAVAKVPYIIDDVFANAVVTGYIPFTTCRDALMQVAFAIQAVVDTSNSDVVKIFALEDEVKQTIPLNRIKQGQNFDDDDTVTAVEVTAHAYAPIEDIVEVYKADDSGVGEEIMVTFSEPLHSLSIVNGEILESGNTFARINAREGAILSGKSFYHTTNVKRINNPLVSATETERVVAVDRATLVSANNLDKVLEKCYNYIVKTSAVNLGIIEGKHIADEKGAKYGFSKYGVARYGVYSPKVIEYDQSVNVGDVVSAETEYLGVVTGRAIKQTFNLNGGIIVKDTVLR